MIFFVFVVNVSVFFIQKIAVIIWWMTWLWQRVNLPLQDPRVACGTAMQVSFCSIQSICWDDRDLQGLCQQFCFGEEHPITVRFMLIFCNRSIWYLYWFSILGTSSGHVKNISSLSFLGLHVFLHVFILTTSLHFFVGLSVFSTPISTLTGYLRYPP